MTKSSLIVVVNLEDVLWFYHLEELDDLLPRQIYGCWIGNAYFQATSFLVGVVGEIKSCTLIYKECSYP